MCVATARLVNVHVPGPSAHRHVWGGGGGGGGGGGPSFPVTWPCVRSGFNLSFARWFVNHVDVHPTFDAHKSEPYSLSALVCRLTRAHVAYTRAPHSALSRDGVTERLLIQVPQLGRTPSTVVRRPR